MNRLTTILLVSALAGLPAVMAQTGPGEIKITIPKIDVQVPGLTVNEDGTTHSVMDNHQTVTFDCKKEAVSIMGNHNLVTIKGDCTSVSILGNHNTVTIEKVPTLSFMGNDNTATVDTLGSASLMGNNNTLTWSKGQEGDPTVSNLGKDNTVAKAAE